mgnify:CR=1 FL=1
MPDYSKMSNTTIKWLKHVFFATGNLLNFLRQIHWYSVRNIMIKMAMPLNPLVCHMTKYCQPGLFESKSFVKWRQSSDIVRRPQNLKKYIHTFLKLISND